MEDEKIKLKKLTSREMSLVVAEAISKSIEELISILPEYEKIHNVFIYHDGLVENWRNENWFYKELPLKVAEWTREEEKLARDIATYLEKYRKATDYLQSIQSKVTTPKESVSKIKETISLFEEAVQGLLLAVWLVRWNYELRKQKNTTLFNQNIVESAEKLRDHDTHSFNLLETVTGIVSQKLRSIEKDMGLRSGITNFLTLKELEQFIVSERPLREKDFLPRREGYVLMNNQVYLKDKLNNLLLEKFYVLEEEEGSTRKNKIFGQVACSGKVRGGVIKVRVREDIDKVKEGDILVAPMTTPWYEPVFSKVAGIITDEGGITCHAAITSRELNIPCVIGTGIATSVLNDGDVVELDSDTGVIVLVDKMLM